MVEESSTIPLSKVSQTANISFAEHGELNSRARCLPRRRSPARLSSLKMEDLKSGFTFHQTSADEVIQDRYLFEPLLDSSPTMQKSWGSAADMISPSEFIWEQDGHLGLESFQDLSEYCQENQLEPNNTKLETSASGNMNALQDDELNTPEIKYREAFFGNSGGLIQSPVDDGDGWPVTVNSRPGTFDLSIAEAAQEQQLEFDVISPDNATVNLYSPIEQDKEKRMGISEQLNCNVEHLNIVVEREETVEMLPSEIEVDSLNRGEIKREPSNVGLHLNLSSEPMKTAEFASTPDVLQQLESPQTYFDLINFIVKDTDSPQSVESTIDFSALQFFPRATAPSDEPVQEQNPELSLSEPSNEQQPSQPSEQPVEDRCELEPSYSVVSAGQNSADAHVRITIKREPEKSRRPSRSKRTTSYVDLMKEEVDDSDYEDELPSPAKRRKRSNPSCSTDGDAPCPRYRELRDRNNEASRRSRQTRKAREDEMKVQSQALERENQQLKIRCDELEKQLATFRQLLVDILSSRKTNLEK